MSNPLLSMDGLPPFSKIKPEHVQPAIQQAIDDAKQRIADVLRTTDSLTWDSLIAPLEETDDRLSCIWFFVSYMNSVVNSDELRAAYEACLTLLAEYQTFIKIKRTTCSFNSRSEKRNSCVIGEFGTF